MWLKIKILKYWSTRMCFKFFLILLLGNIGTNFINIWTRLLSGFNRVYTSQHFHFQYGNGTVFITVIKYLPKNETKNIKLLKKRQPLKCKIFCKHIILGTVLVTFSCLNALYTQLSRARAYAVIACPTHKYVYSTHAYTYICIKYLLK